VNTAPAIPTLRSTSARRSPVQRPATVYLAGLAPGSRPAQAHALGVIAGLLSGGRLTPHTLPWERVAHQHTAALRSALAERYAPATANRMLAALRGVLRAAWRLRLMDAEAYHRAVDVKAVRGSRLPKGRGLERGELRAMFKTIAEDNRPAVRARDAAMLALLYGAGLRRAELVALDLADYDVTAGTLRVQGKGRKERLLHAANGTADALAAWLTMRGPEPGPLFTPVTPGGQLRLGERLTPAAVFDWLRRLVQRAGIARCAPHDLRRSFISDLLDAGADIAVVQQLAGHANVQTTARYDRRGEQAKRRAVGMLAVPYVHAD